MNKFLLYLVMLPSGLWKALGADTDQLRAILDVRLMLDDRKPLSMVRNQKKKKDRKYGTLISSIILLMMGGFYMFPVLIVHDRIYSLTIYFSMILTVITFMLITDFSNVLFDSRDKFILFPRPVTDRTLVLARMLHVFIYLFRMAVPLMLPAWIALGIVDGWKSAVVFVVPLVMVIFLALFVVNIVYLLVLRLSKPEKFKDVINYFQVVTSVIFFASVYLLPRLFDMKNNTEFHITDHPWLRYTPPYWLADCWSWVGEPVYLTGTASYSALAIALPILCMFILVRWLSPQFARRIAGIDVTEGAAPAAAKKMKGSGFYQRLAYAFNSTDDARAGFMLTWLQSGRSRSFRMRVYPSFAFIPIYFVYILTQNGTSISEAFQNMEHNHKKQLLLLYMCSFVMINALNYLTISDQYKAAWVYYSTPIQTPGRVMVGGVKAIWVKYFLPFYLLVSVFVFYVWGPSALFDVLLTLVNITLFVACICRINYRHLPFSMVEQMKQRGARIVKSLLTMIIPFALGFGHVLSLDLLWLKIVFLALSSIMLWLVWDSYANTDWDSVVRSELE